MKIRYIERSFRPEALEIIQSANKIIAEYERAGYKLTLRQLYYQFVSRDLIENTVQSYKRLGNIINDGRLAGLVSWEAIEDRTRNLKTMPSWSDASNILGACASQFRITKWDEQPTRVEVWIEKEALAGVFERACWLYEIPFFCCRGYTSASEVWSAAQRFIKYHQAGQNVVILHFGDHDPSGIDMSRDIRDRLEMFGAKVDFRRMALTMEQIEEHGPPPNPAKETDSRFTAYRDRYGDESWELDALDPDTLNTLVADEVSGIIDHEKWEYAHRAEKVERKRLRACADQWSTVSKILDKSIDDDDDEDSNE